MDLDKVAEPVPAARRRRGFAVMNRDRVREIAREGGKAAHAKGVAHEFTSEEARIAGHKGGVAAHQKDPPKSSPPKGLSVTTLIKGSGPKLVKGDTVVAQYVGSIWRTGKVFSTSWPSAQAPTGQPFSFSLGTDVVPGWAQGLAGVPVGSRVMLVIPPALGYGPEGGQASAGIKKDDTLVFVVDVLGRVAGTSSAG